MDNSNIFLLKQEESSTESQDSKICRTEYNLLTKVVTADLSRNPDCLYRLRVQLLSKEVQALNQDYKTLQTKLNALQDFISKTTHDTIAEEKNTRRKYSEQKVEQSTMFPAFDKIFRINKDVANPLLPHEKIKIEMIMSIVMDKIRNVHNEDLQFLALNYGYVSDQPISGLQCRMTIIKNKERHITRSRQKFGAIQSRILKTSSEKKIVNIVTPLAGRLSTFEQFMKNIEENILKKQEQINILIVYFPQNTSYTAHKKIFERYTMTYKDSSFTWLNLPGKFARAQALQAAVDFYKNNRLLFFADVDLTFNTEFLQRCHDNTIPGKQVYYPVMFKFFNEKISGFRANSTNMFGSFDPEFGYWVKHSYGPICAHRDDINSVGGFNIALKEWGYEDVQLYEAFLKRSKYNVFRVVDPGLFHVYHTHVRCDVIKNKISRKACEEATLKSLAAEKSVVDYLTKKKYIF